MLSHLLALGAHVADQLLLSIIAAKVDRPVAGEEGVLVHIWHRYMWRGSLRNSKRSLRCFLCSKLVVVIHELSLSVVVVKAIVLPGTILKILNVSLLFILQLLLVFLGPVTHS